MERRALSMRKKLLLLSIAIASSAMIVAGCGSDGSGATKAEEDAFKQHDASKLSGPPPGASQKPPADFKSSLGSGIPGPPTK